MPENGERVAHRLPLNNPWPSRFLLRTLRILHQTAAAATLAHRISTQADLNAQVKIWGVSELLRELHDTEVPGAAEALLTDRRPCLAPASVESHRSVA
jgi:hypothetical protein